MAEAVPEVPEHEDIYNKEHVPVYGMQVLPGHEQEAEDAGVQEVQAEVLVTPVMEMEMKNMKQIEVCHEGHGQDSTVKQDIENNCDECGGDLRKPLSEKKLITLE